jgi:hypothetical protein
MLGDLVTAYLPELNRNLKGYQPYLIALFVACLWAAMAVWVAWVEREVTREDLRKSIPGTSTESRKIRVDSKGGVDSKGD